MSTLQERITLALHSHPDKPRQAALGRACGVASASVTAWFKGETKSMKGETLLKAARFLNVRPEWLESGLGPMRDVEGESVSRVEVREPSSAVVTPLPRPSLRSALEVLCTALSVLREPERRESVGTLLRACAVGGGDTSYIDAIIATMRKSHPPQALANEAQ